jgi:hypothetical protein
VRRSESGSRARAPARQLLCGRDRADGRTDCAATGRVEKIAAAAAARAAAGYDKWFALKRLTSWSRCTKI